MTTVIADSGSTKTDWRIITNNKENVAFSTIGFNPVLTNAALIIKELEPFFVDNLLNQSVEKIHYYGAGCWNKESCSIVQKALAVFFKNADIQVTNDLLGAARAVCGNQAGIACILGTGANSCLYDGQKIVDNIPALGYIMGDEGSGAYLGKQLLQSYFYRALPQEIAKKLTREYDISKKILLEKVYQHKGGNKYLASFAKFIMAHKKHPFIKKMLADSFDDFINKQLLKYDNATDFSIHFIGSIAYFSKEILSEVLENNGLQLGKIIRQPIEGLVEFHSKNIHLQQKDE